MFTVRCTGDPANRSRRFSDESLYKMYPSQERKPHPLYRSQFATKVRIDKWCQKSGCYQTMGPPKVPYQRPELYLRKHSRLPPVFFDPNDLKMDKPSKSQEMKPVKDKYKLSKQSIPKYKRNGCLYPPPPKDMGRFRANSDPTYEQLYRKRANVQGDCCMNNSDPEMSRQPTKKDMTEKAPENRKNRVGYNGPLNMIQRGQRDFLRENALKILRMPPKRPVRCYINESGQHQVDLSQGPYVLRPGFGQVPKYLEKRKQEIFEEDMELKRRMDNRPECRVISDAEREFIIQGLEEHWSDLNREYLRLPFPSTTLRVARLRAQLEDKFKELEDDIRLFKTTDELMVEDVAMSQYY